jgi:asparagine N-glycosylation enzyme membrane subunit Stt3
LLEALILGFISIIVPGFFLALALLKKTKLPMFEIVIMGFIFGLIFPPTMIWLEAYLINISHFFAYSEALYNINIIVLTIIGVALCFQQKAFDFDTKNLFHPFSRNSDAKSMASEAKIDIEVINRHKKEENDLKKRHASELELINDPEQRSRVMQLHNDEEERLRREHEQEEEMLLQSVKENERKKPFLKSEAFVFAVLFAIMLITFFTRMASIGIAPHFFEFDPYFDMQSTTYILTFGQQLLLEHSAWPTLVAGTAHTIQPIVPYLEAYWYDLAAGVGNGALNTTLLSDVGSFYPPITAALLVFVVFMLLYHDYGKLPGLLGAALVAGMPALITTFIAGEQLLEPWGIFAMFFFYATYLLAVRNPKEWRFAVLAGIAFASNFLGAHYFTVTTGVFAAYILVQGLINVFRKKRDMKEFYMMNIIVLAVITVFYILYAPYGATLSQSISSILFVPIIIAFPLFALVFVALLDFIPKYMQERKIINSVDIFTQLGLLLVFALIAVLLILFTPIGKPIKAYVALSAHYTTPSIPLFMTVQEYEPTGITYNFGAQGFGYIGESIGGIPIIIWLVLALFTVLALLSIYYQKSDSSVLYFAMIIPLAVAGMTEVKYLPHFGVGYIIAIGVIVGIIIEIAKHDFKLNFKLGSPGSFDTHKLAERLIMALVFFLLIIGFLPSMTSIVSAAANPNCSSILNNSNGLGYTLYCTTVPNYWINATTWMRENIGPYAPRILSWWDYGDWINWFGNSNAVLRGDNAVATLDYATAAQYVFSPVDGYGPSTLANFMNKMQAQYVLFDNQLQQKWEALDFLACIDVNQTSMAYATQQGSAQGVPYLLGTSACETSHDPVYALIPVTPSSVNAYCNNFANGTAIQAFLTYGSSIENQTYCVPTSIFSQVKPVPIYSSNGTKLNALIIPTQQFFYGTVSLYGQNFADFMVIYTPGANGTISAPTQFYNSNYYQGFMFGKLKGYTLAYPSNFSGINYINSTNPVMIFRLDNYSGGIPPHTPKPSWINNNFTVPG